MLQFVRTKRRLGRLRGNGAEARVANGIEGVIIDIMSMGKHRFRGVSAVHRMLQGRNRRLCCKEMHGPDRLEDAV